MIRFSNALGLDVGDKRIGVARVNSVAQIPEPLTTIPNDNAFFASIRDIIKTHGIDLIVCGIPRNMSGLETAQSEVIRDFISLLKKELPSMQIETQDETLTTVDAQSMIHGGMHGDKDSVAAGYILADFITELRRSHV